MSWPTTRLQPVESNDNDVGFVKGRQVLPTAVRLQQNKSMSSQEQFTAVFGYSPSDHLSRGTLGGDGVGRQSSNSAPPKDSKGSKSPSPLRQSMSEDMQQALGYRTKRKSEHDLTPAQQRAFQFRNAINKSTISLQPDLTPGSIMDSAAGYALPPSSPPPTLSPAILDGLRPGPAASVSDGSMLGTMVLPKDLKPFSSSTRLPYQQTNGGPGGEAGPGGPGGTYFLMPPVDVSMADAYNYSVPAEVRTGEDAVRLFSSSAAKSGLIIYCNLNPDCRGGEYNPYDLLVVDRARVDPRHHYVLTQSGVTQMLGGHAQELQPFHAWQRDRDLFTVLRKLVFFKHNEVFQAFWQWRDAVRVLKFRARQRTLSHQLLLLSPTFQRALLNVRRMTLAVSTDTNGTWRKMSDGRWVEVEAELYAPSLTALPPLPPRSPQHSLPQLRRLSVAMSSTSGSAPIIDPLGAALAAAAAANNAANNVALGLSGPPASTVPGSGPSFSISNLVLPANLIGGGGALNMPSSGQETVGVILPDGVGGGVTDIGGLEFEPPTPLPPERLPESGLPYQLGYIGSVTEQYSLPDFKRMREEQRNSVNAALGDMVSYVRGQVQVVGRAVQEALAAAQAAVAKPTRQEARQQRFEAPGPQAWKSKSVALAQLDAEQRQRALRDAVHAAQQLLRFITLADALMLGQLSELARLSVLLCVRQLELPRKAGLYIVAGSVEDLAVAAAATAGAARGAGGLPAWGRTSTFVASVSFATNNTMGRRRSAGLSLRNNSMQGSYPGEGPSPRVRNGGAVSDDDDDDTMEGVPAPAPSFVYNPSGEDLSTAVSNVPREILHVVLVSSAPLMSHPEVRQLVAEIGAKGIPLPPAALAATMAAGGGAGGGGGGGVVVRGGGGFHGEVLRAAVDVRTVMTRLQTSVLNDYNNAMQHPAMMPFRSREVLWGMVSRFNADNYRSAGTTPEQLHADLAATSSWLSEMSSARTTVIVGLVVLDMSALQRAALPVVQRAHSGIMSLLGGLLVMQSQRITASLAGYTAHLVARPSQLPEFVSYVEVIWPHLDPMSSTRQAISADLEHMTRLHVMYLESTAAGQIAGRGGTPTMYHPLYWSASHADDEDDELADPSQPPSSRKVRLTWEALQGAIARYSEEARLAADYFQTAAALMVTHLKTSLIESGNALQLLLLQLRMGPSTDPAAAAPDVAAHLASLSDGLRTLAAAVEQHSSWARLLTHPSTTSLVASLESHLSTARTVLSARRGLCDAMAAWRRFLDRLYDVPCIDERREALTVELAEQVGHIRLHANKITSLHTDDDLLSIRTVTPAEQKLGAHLNLVVKSWQDILPLAQQLVHPAVKPRHLRTLLGWLAAHNAAAAAAAAATAGRSGGAQNGGTAAAAAPLPLLMMQNPYAVLPTHVRQDDASEATAAGRTSLAKLVTACSESSYTRALVTRISQIALGEAQLVTWLQSIQERLQAVPLTYSNVRTWGSFTPTNFPEVLAAVAALVAELGAVQRSPYYSGVLREAERVEQLLGGVQRSLQDASACLDAWTYLCHLHQNPVVTERCPELVSSLDLLGTAWRKLHMAAMEQPTLTAAAVALQECKVLLASFESLRRSCGRSLLPALRDAYPRLWLVGDEVLMGALAAGAELEALPRGLWEGLYGGAVALHVQMREQIEDAPPVPPDVVAVVSATGEICHLRNPLQGPPTGGALRLESWLPALETELRSSLIAHTRDCLAACGYLSPDVWVASYPGQCVMLVDAVVWTQTVTTTLQRTAEGERSALRNLLDQSVLRLETMARQLRSAMVGAPAGLLRSGRQVEDLAARAAGAALTAAGAAAVAATAVGGGGRGEEGLLDGGAEVPMAAATSGGGYGGGYGGGNGGLRTSNASVMGQQQQQPPPPPRMPAFLVTTTAATAAAAATVAAVAAAAVPAVPPAADRNPYGSTEPAVALVGPAATAMFVRPRRSSVVLDPVVSLPAEDSGGSGGSSGSSGGGGGVRMTRQTVRSLERLIAAGICHRHVVEDLIGADVGGPDAFDWQRNIRHYWESETGNLEVAFVTQRHTYGYEYDGTTQDAVELVLPMSVPSLLAAVSALQASPVVSLARADGACSPISAVRSLCSLLGRHHMVASLDASTSPAAMFRTLTTAVQLNSWIVIEGAQLLGLTALAALSELLHGLCTAAATRQPYITFGGESVPSPWAAAATVDSPVPNQRRQRSIGHSAQANTASAHAAAGERAPSSSGGGVPLIARQTPGFFLSLPLAAYLPIAHDAPVPFSDAAGAAAAASAFLTEASHTRGPFPYELCEVARRAGRTVTIHSADLAVALEAGLRCAGLRDAAEAARAAACWFRLAAVQLASPPQLSLDVVMVRTLMSYIHREWLLGTAGGGGGGGGLGNASAGATAGSGLVAAAHHGGGGGVSASGGTRVGGSALDALDAAMRAVVLPAADPEDVSMLTRLLDQVITFAQRTPPPPEVAGAPPTPMYGIPADAALPPPFNVREALHAVLATAREATGHQLLDAVHSRTSKVPQQHHAAAGAPVHRPTASTSDGAVSGSLSSSVTSTSTSTSPARRRGTTGTPPANGNNPAAAASAAGAPAPSHTHPGGAVHGGLLPPPDTVVPPPQPAWLPHVTPLSFANPSLLVAVAASLYDALMAHRGVLLVGPAGAGKSAVWKALVAATHGLEALASSDRVLHLYTETLPAARLQLAPPPDAADGDGGAADGRVPTDWLIRRLEGTLYWALRRRPEGANVRSGSAAVVGSAPRWVVFDGPLGTPRADCLTSLLLTRSVVLNGTGGGAAGGTVLELDAEVHCLWETSSLVAASPALLSAVPVVHVGGGGGSNGSGGVGDMDTVIAMGVRRIVKQQAMTTLVPARFVRRLVTLLTAAVTGAEGVMRRVRERERGNHGPPPGLTLASGLIAMLGEVVRSLDVPGEPSWTEQPADLELAAARCAVFASYWTLAGQVLGPQQRTQVEAAVREAAATAELHMALPLGGSLAAWLVAPKRGMWVRWSATLHSLSADRPTIVPGMRVAGGGGTTGGSVPHVNFHYYRDIRTGAGTLGLFVPSAATQALQYAMQLALQAGHHPVLVGPPGSGRRTLLYHMLATVPVQQLRTLVAVAPVSAAVAPAALQAMLLWQLAPGAGGALRPTPGHRVVMVIEDINVAATGGCHDGRFNGELAAAAAQEAGAGMAAAAAVAGSGAAAAGSEVEVPTPGLEWLRHVLDERAVRDPVTGTRLLIHGTSFAGTSTHHALLTGAEQFSSRLRRHLLAIHIDAAARCGPDPTNPFFINDAAHQGLTTLTTIFNRPAVVLALAQHTAAHLSYCGVWELTAAAGGAGTVPAVAVVLAGMLEGVVRSVAALTRAGITPALWHFDTGAVSAVVRRLCSAVSIANGVVPLGPEPESRRPTTSLTPVASGIGGSDQPSAFAHTATASTIPATTTTIAESSSSASSHSEPPHWGLRHVLQRLVFEVGRGLLGHLTDGSSRVALAKLLLQTMGQHLGLLASGRLDLAVASARTVLETPLPPPAVAAAATVFRDDATHSSAFKDPPTSLTSQPDNQEALKVLAAWADYSSRGVSDITSLRVSLAGRIPPREINLLLAAFMGTLPLYDEPYDADDSRAATLAWPIDLGGAMRCMGSSVGGGGAGMAGGGGGGGAATSVLGTAESLLAPGPPPGTASYGTSYGPESSAVGWLARRPLGLPDLLRCVRALAGLPRRDTLGGYNSSAIPTVPSTGERSITIVGPGGGNMADPDRVRQSSSVVAGVSYDPSAARPLPHCNLGPVSLALLEDAAGHWGYVEMVRPVAMALFDGYFSGGHVVLIGGNTPMLEQLASLAALGAGAHLIRIDRPKAPRSNGATPAPLPDEYGVRQVVQQHLMQVLQVLAENGDAVNVRQYSQELAVVTGGFSAPGHGSVPVGEADAMALLVTPPSPSYTQLYPTVSAVTAATAVTTVTVGSVVPSVAQGVASSSVTAISETGRPSTVPSAPRRPPQPSAGLHVLLLTDSMLQDTPTLELLQALLVHPSASGPLCKELNEGYGLPILRGLEPLVFDADLGLLMHTTSSAAHNGGEGDVTAGGGGLSAASSPTPPPPTSGGSGGRQTLGRALLNRMLGQAMSHARRRGGGSNTANTTATGGGAAVGSAAAGGTVSGMEAGQDLDLSTGSRTISLNGGNGQAPYGSSNGIANGNDTISGGSDMGGDDHQQVILQSHPSFGNHLNNNNHNNNGNGANGGGGTGPQQASGSQSVSTIPPMRSEADSSSYGAARVSELRASEVTRAEVEVGTWCRLVAGVRFLLAASPATWARLRRRYPVLAAALTAFSTAPPQVEDQQDSCTEALLTIAPNVADNTIPQSGSLHLPGEDLEDLAPLPRSTNTSPSRPRAVSPHNATSRPGSPGPPRKPQHDGPTGLSRFLSRPASPERSGSGVLGPSGGGGPPRRTMTLTDRMESLNPKRPLDEVVAERVAVVARAAADAALLRRVGEVAVAMHGQAQELYRQLGLLEPGACLPLSKMSDLVHMLSLVHSSHRKVLQARQATLHVCLSKLATSEVMLSRCVEAMDRLNSFMDISREDLKTLSARVAHLEKFVSETSVELADQVAKADATQAVVDQVHAEVETEVMAAEERYQRALSEVDGLTEADLSEIRSYKEPHVLIRLVVMALCVLFEAPSDWRNAQRLLSEPAGRLMERCRSLDVRGGEVTPVQVAKLARLLQEPEFNVVSVEQVSNAAKPLAWWVISVSTLLRTIKEGDMKLARIREGEERLENTRAYIRKLRGELKAGQTELSRQQQEQRSLEHQLREAGARLRDNEMQRSNIGKLTGLVQGLIPQWRADLAAVEARLPALIGDATLAVAAVVYLGPLDGLERSAVLGLWRELMERRGVPVGPPPFDFSAFVADRFEQMTAMLPVDLIANTQPLWRDNLAHMALASRPPLLLDPGREGANLVKAMFGKSSRVFYLLSEDGLLDKIASAVRGGRAVVVDMYGTPSEAPILARVCKRYEQAMRRCHTNLAVEPHHLYFRMRAGSPALSPAVLQYTTPVRFALRGNELRAALKRSLLATLAPDREIAVRQMSTRVWQHRARLSVLRNDIAFTIAHTKGLIWSHPGLVDSSVTLATQAAADAEALPNMEATLAEVWSTLECWSPLVDGVMRVHGVLEDLARAGGGCGVAGTGGGGGGGGGAGGWCGPLPESVLIAMFRSALRRGVGEVPGAMGWVRELQGPTAPIEMSVEEARRRGARALVAELRSRAPSRAMSRMPSVVGPAALGRAASAAGMSAFTSSSYGGGDTDEGDHTGGDEGGIGGRSMKLRALSRRNSGTTAVSRGVASFVYGGPGGTITRPDSAASSVWTTWNDNNSGGGGGFATADAEAAALLLQQQSSMSNSSVMIPPPPATCRMEDVAAAVLQGVWSLTGAVLGRAEGCVFRFLLAVAEQQEAGDLAAEDAQLVLYVLGKGAPSAQAAAGALQQAAAAAAAAVAGTRPGPAGAGAAATGSDAPAATHATPPPTTSMAFGSTDGAADTQGTAATDAAGVAGRPFVSRPPSRPSSFTDGATQAAVKQLLGAAAAGGTTSTTESQDSVDCPWPSEEALADLRWLSSCAAGGGGAGGTDLWSLAAAVAAAPRVWYTVLTADAAPRGCRPDMRSALAQGAAGQLPERWRELLARKPLYQVLLTGILAPEALAAAADAYSDAVLGPAAATADLTPGERLLSVLMASPPAHPVILATAPGEDPVAVVQQAQALCANHLLPVESHRDAHWSTTECIVRHMQQDPASVRDLRAALIRAARSSSWLLLLGAHASPAAIAMLMEQINARDYMMRGSGTTFRLILALPADAVPRLHLNVLSQCVRVALQRPASLRAAAAGAMTELAHPSSRRFGQLFGARGGSDIDLANHVLATALLMAGLNRAVSTGALPPVAPPLSTWDFLAAVKIVRQSVLEGRAADDSSSLDYPRLHELLATEVLLPALPATRLGRFAGWAMQRLLAPGVFTLSYPVYGLVDPDAEPGNEVASSMPLNVRLPSMLDYLASLYGVETALQPPYAASHALQQRGESLAAALTLHRLAAAAAPVVPVRLALLPAEHPAVAPLAVQVAAAERVLSAAAAVARSGGTPLWVPPPPTSPPPAAAAAASTLTSSGNNAGDNAQSLLVDETQVLVLDNGTTIDEVGGGASTSKPATPSTHLAQLRVPLTGYSARVRLQQLQAAAAAERSPQDVAALHGGGGGSGGQDSGETDGRGDGGGGVGGGGEQEVGIHADAGASGGTAGRRSSIRSPSMADPATQLAPIMSALQPRPSTVTTIFAIASAVPSAASRGGTPAASLQQQLRAMISGPSATGASILITPWRGAWDSRPGSTTVGTAAAAAAEVVNAAGGGGSTARSSVVGIVSSPTVRFMPAGPADVTLRMNSDPVALTLAAAAAAANKPHRSESGSSNGGDGDGGFDVVPGLAALLVSTPAGPAPELALLDAWAAAVLTPLLEGLRHIEVLLRGLRLALESRLHPHGEIPAVAATGMSVGSGMGSGASGGKAAAAAVAAATAAAAARAAHPTLSTNLSAIFAELWIAEARVLHGAVCGALGGCEEVAAAVAQPSMYDTPGVHQLIRHLTAGFVPLGWYLAPLALHPCTSGGAGGGGGSSGGHVIGTAAGGGRTSRTGIGPPIACPPGSRHPVHMVTLEQWKYDVSVRVRQLQEVTSAEVDLRPTSVDLACLARPAALLVCLRRAFAYEQNAHPNNVVCRLSLHPPSDAAAITSAAASYTSGSIGTPSIGTPDSATAAAAGRPLRASTNTGSGAYPIAAPRSIGVSGLLCRDLEVPLAGLVGLGLAVGLAAGLNGGGYGYGIPPTSSVSNPTTCDGAPPGSPLLLLLPVEVHSTYSFAAAPAAGGASSVAAAASASGASNSLGGASSVTSVAVSAGASTSAAPSLPRPESSRASSSAAAAAALSAPGTATASHSAISSSQASQATHQHQNQHQQHVNVLQQQTAAAALAALRACPTLYAIPGFADPALRKALGSRVSVRPNAGGGGGRNSRASAAVMAGIPASAVAPPLVAVPMAASLQQAMLCDEPYRVAWEHRVHSLAADAPPERLPLLAVRRPGGGEALGGDRGTVLRLAASWGTGTGMGTGGVL